MEAPFFTVVNFTAVAKQNYFSKKTHLRFLLDVSILHFDKLVGEHRRTTVTRFTYQSFSGYTPSVISFAIRATTSGLSSL